MHLPEISESVVLPIAKMFQPLLTSIWSWSHRHFWDSLVEVVVDKMTGSLYIPVKMKNTSEMQWSKTQLVISLQHLSCCGRVWFQVSISHMQSLQSSTHHWQWSTSCNWEPLELSISQGSSLHERHSNQHLGEHETYQSQLSVKNYDTKSIVSTERHDSGTAVIWTSLCVYGYVIGIARWLRMGGVRSCV